MSTGLRQFLSKHCVCLWSEKTTVCRIFSCQRSTLPGVCRQSVNVGWGLARHRSSAQQTIARRRCARDSRASFAHRNFFRRRPPGFGATGANVRCRFKYLQPPSAGLPGRRSPRTRLACLAEAAFNAAARRRLVENTGLEPVTSWLQTRRSPS